MAQVWRNRFSCRFCGHKWRSPRYDTKAEADAAYEAAGGNALECPNCLKVMKARGIDFNNPRAPAMVGQNISVKAIDQTAQIVMQDYGMTDLRTDVREHETAAPKLPPMLQAQADNFFVGRGKRHPQLRTQPAALGAAAIRGAFRQQPGYEPVAALHGMDPGVRETIRPQTRIVADTRRLKG
jgi:hypothetical protein